MFRLWANLGRFQIYELAGSEEKHTLFSERMADP
jgi:hypothetical protein